jgi:hypothetical protein
MDKRPFMLGRWGPLCTCPAFNPWQHEIRTLTQAALIGRRNRGPYIVAMCLICMAEVVLHLGACPSPSLEGIFNGATYFRHLNYPRASICIASWKWKFCFWPCVRLRLSRGHKNNKINRFKVVSVITSKFSKVYMKIRWYWTLSNFFMAS